MRWRLRSCVNQRNITTAQPDTHLRLLLPRDASASLAAAGLVNGSADSATAGALTLAAAAVFLLCPCDAEGAVSFVLPTPWSLGFRRAEEGGGWAADRGACLELLPRLWFFLGGGEGQGAHDKSGETVQGEDAGIIGASSSVILSSSSSLWRRSCGCILALKCCSIDRNSISL